MAKAVVDRYAALGHPVVYIHRTNREGFKAGALQNGLEALPVIFREVIVLKELEDMSYKEIAGMTGVPIGTVMSRLARGREMLKKELLRNDQ